MMLSWKHVPISEELTKMCLVEYEQHLIENTWDKLQEDFSEEVESLRIDIREQGAWTADGAEGQWIIHYYDGRFVLIIKSENNITKIATAALFAAAIDDLKIVAGYLENNNNKKYESAEKQFENAKYKVIQRDRITNEPEIYQRKIGTIRKIIISVSFGFISIKTVSSNFIERRLISIDCSHNAEKIKSYNTEDKINACINAAIHIAETKMKKSKRTLPIENKKRNRIGEGIQEVMEFMNEGKNPYMIRGKNGQLFPISHYRDKAA